MSDNHHYFTKPQPVLAFQWRGDNEDEAAEFVGLLQDGSHFKVNHDIHYSLTISVYQGEGGMRANLRQGDWIVVGEKVSVYPDSLFQERFIKNVHP